LILKQSARVLPFAQTVDAAFDALDAFKERLRSGDRSAPTRLEGWDVDALARHVGAVAWQQGEAFHRARAAIGEAPSYLEIKLDDPVEAIELGAAHLRSGIDQLDAASEPIVPLPFAALPASFAAAVLLIEYGVHLNDLEHAFGEPTELREPVADAVVELMGAMLPGLASSGPDGPTSCAIRAEGRAPTCVAWRDGAWLSVPDGDADCTIEGTASQIALFALGRIPSSDVTVTGNAALADAFKTFFPGP
jgi:uncharacterized protein (TIGR03083 family)